MASKIERLMELSEAATPGPWHQKNRTHNVYSVCGPDGLGIVNADSPRTAEFIAAANPETIRAMLTLMQEMRTALGAVRPNHGTIYAACVSFDRWNESEENS